MSKLGFIVVGLFLVILVSIVSQSHGYEGFYEGAKSNQPNKAKVVSVKTSPPPKK